MGAGAEAPKAPELRDFTNIAEEHECNRSSRQRAEAPSRRHKNTNIPKRLQVAVVVVVVVVAAAAAVVVVAVLVVVAIVVVVVAIVAVEIVAVVVVVVIVERLPRVLVV